MTGTGPLRPLTDLLPGLPADPQRTAGQVCGPDGCGPDPVLADPDDRAPGRTVDPDVESRRSG